MKLRRIMSAMLAAALVTSTVAFAEDIATESELDINLTVENNKGTYTFTDEEYASYLEYFEDAYGWGEDAACENTEGYIFNNNSQFIIGDSTMFNTDQIYLVEFEAIDIQKDADGNTSFVNVGTANMGPAKDQYAMAASTLLWCVNPIPELHDTTPSSKDGLGNAVDVSRITKYAPTFLNCDDYEIDMLVVWFWYGKDKAEMDVDHSGRERPVIPDSSRFACEWVFTESCAAMLNEANAGTSAPEAPEAPAADYSIDVTEALTADDIADVIAANADSDVVINGDNGVSFKFAKGTMAAVDGVDAYDFTSAISTDLADAASDKLTEDNFVLSIDYAYSGKLPAKAEISIPVGTEYAGKTLYYSRVLENGVKLIDSAKVDENGFITVSQDSCSDYLLTTEDISADAAGSTEGADSKDKQSADTGAQGVAAAAGIVLAAGAAVLFSRKRK